MLTILHDLTHPAVQAGLIRCVEVTTIEDTDTRCRFIQNVKLHNTDLFLQEDTSSSHYLYYASRYITASIIRTRA